jgi:hypothetical protein
MAEKTNLQSFHETFRDRDHEEARIIDGFYDKHFAQDDTDKVGALALAYADTEDALKDKFPFAGEMGYEAAKRAMRWWNYRVAYERDYGSMMTHEKAVELGEKRNAVGDEILSGSPLHIGWYALADAARLRANLRGREIADVLEVEKQAAYALLLNTFDSLLFGPQAKVVSPSHRSFTGEIEDDGKTRLITINGAWSDGISNYEYSEQAASIPADQPAARNVMFLLEEKGGRITAHGVDVENTPLDLETERALHLAHLVATSTDFGYQPRY